MSEQQFMHQIDPVSPSVLQHIHSRLAPRAPFRLLGYSFGGLVALELALKLEAEGREGKLYLVDSAPDFLKATLTQTIAGDDEEFQTNVICAMFKVATPHEATPAAVSKVYHERNVKSYEYWNALSFGVWRFKFVAIAHSWGSIHSNTQLCSWSYYNYIVFNTLVG
jgi:thioesterase domain-containing protein